VDRFVLCVQFYTVDVFRHSKKNLTMPHIWDFQQLWFNSKVIR